MPDSGEEGPATEPDVQRKKRDSRTDQTLLPEDGAGRTLLLARPLTLRGS